MRVILIGPRSIGKSTIGKGLAKKLKVRYFDFDDYVEKVLGRINDYVEKYGADSYRLKENRILKSSIKNLPRNFVISLGGGTIASQLKKISKENLRIIKENGKIVYLAPAKNTKDSIAILYHRERKREGDKSLEETRKLYLLRTPVYEKNYDLKIILGDRAPSQIIKDLLKRLK